MQISPPSKVQGGAVVGASVEVEVEVEVVGASVEVEVEVDGASVEVEVGEVGTEEGSVHIPEIQLRPVSQGPTLLASSQVAPA